MQISQDYLVSTGQLLLRTTTLPLLSSRANPLLMVVQRPLDGVKDEVLKNIPAGL